MAKIPALGLGKKERIDFLFQECLENWGRRFMKKYYENPSQKSILVFLLFCDLVGKSYEQEREKFCIPALPF